MKIGVNLIHLAPGKAGGTEGYIRNLLNQLALLDEKNEYYLFTSLFNFRSFLLPNARWKKLVYTGDEASPSTLISHPEARRVPPQYRIKNAVRKLRAYPHRQIDQDLAGTIKSLGLDLWFCPLVYALPSGLDIPIVNVVPDIQHIFFPEYFDPVELLTRTIGFESSCRAAAATLTFSDASRRQLISNYSLPEDRVFAFAPGIALEFLLHTNQMDSVAQKVKRKFKLHKPYIYYPSYGWKHKNHERLITAFSKLVHNGYDLDLILSGTEFDLPDRIDGMITKHGLEERVRHLGYLEMQDVVGLFSLARVIAFPSLFEGFGLPVLEGLQMRIPIACSHLPSLKEIAGDAAIYFDPHSQADIVAAITTVLTDNDIRNTLVTKGRQRARNYSYEKTAKGTLGVFDKILRKESGFTPTLKDLQIV